MPSWILSVVGLAGGAWLVSRDPDRAPPGTTWLGFAGLAVGMAAPLVAEPHRWMLAAGAGPDAFIGDWNLWWTRTALARGTNPFFCDLLFAPAGTSLALHTHAVTWGVLAWPLARVADPAVVYNVVVVGSFALTASLTWRLARFLTGHHEASVLAAAVFSWSAFRLANTVRLHALATEWLVLLVAALVVLLRRPTPRGLPAVALAGVLLVHASLEYTAYAVALGAFLAAAEFARRYRAHQPLAPEGSAGAWLAAAGVALGTLGLAIPFLRALRARLAEGGPEFDPGLAGHFSADVIDFFVPNPRHPLWGGATEAWTARLHAGDGGFGLSLGIGALVLYAAAAATVLRARTGRAWLAAGAGCLALALGPDLRIGGVAHPLPMPHDGVAAVMPWLEGSRTPIRWIAPAGLCLAMTLAVGWSRWRSGAGGLSRTGLAVLGLVLFESYAVLPMTDVEIPAVWREIAASPATGAVVHVPELPPREKLLYQTVHGKPVAGNLIGAIPHRSPSADATLQDPAWAILLRDFGRPGFLAGLAPEERTRALASVRSLLARCGVRWIVVSPSGWVHEARGASRRALLPPANREAFLESLRALLPVREQAFGDEVLFELAEDSPAGG